MTQEEKSLLLQDLCARLKYGVKVNHFGAIRELLGIIPSAEIVMVGYDINDYEDSVIEDIKPYLRPMSSMTEEEKKAERKLWDIVTTTRNDLHYLYTDFLNSHHLDYRGLIPMGLALPAKEGMYNN